MQKAPKIRSHGNQIYLCRTTFSIDPTLDYNESMSRKARHMSTFIPDIPSNCSPRKICTAKDTKAPNTARRLDHSIILHCSKVNSSFKYFSSASAFLLS
mmetsp:Transcript_25041/g.51867  ORF Transcript_25041/g.51867 Transcript_25041/m.51867 type:complete len:99 (+) Transcript_25041:1144-1440(+)